MSSVKGPAWVPKLLRHMKLNLNEFDGEDDELPVRVYKKSLREGENDILVDIRRIEIRGALFRSTPVSR